MKASSKVLVGLGLGLIAGGVAGYLLNSDKGRELQADTKVKLDELQDAAKESYIKNSEIVSERVSSATHTISDKVGYFVTVTYYYRNNQYKIGKKK